LRLRRAENFDFFRVSDRIWWGGQNNSSDNTAPAVFRRTGGQICRQGITMVENAILNK